MRAEEVSPTDVTYATLADACGKAGEVGLAHEMAAKIGPKAQVQVRRMAVTALIKAHAVARDPARALEVAIEAKRSGVGIREAGWGALMDAYANVADPIKVQECIGRMEKEGMHANRVHWSILVKAHCNAGDTTAALRVMREEVRTPDVVCYNTVLNAAMRFKHLDNLIVALRDMEQSGVEQRVERHHVRFETARPKVFNGGKGLPGQASSPKCFQKSIVRCNLQQSRRISSQQGHGGIGKQWPLMHAERSLGGHHPRCYMPLVHGKFEELSSLYRAAACGKHIE